MKFELEMEHNYGLIHMYDKIGERNGEGERK